MPKLLFCALASALTLLEGASLPPGINGHYPPDGAAGFPIDSAFLVRVEKGIQPQAVLETAASGERVPLSMSARFDSGVAFKPEQVLRPSTQYRVRLAAGFGRPEYSFQFTTSTGRDSEPPRITGLEPASGATGVGLRGPIVVRFSEPVPGGFGVRVNGGSVHANDLTPDHLGVIVEFDNGIVGKADVVVDPTGFRDLADNAGIGGPVSAQYTTFLAQNSRGPELLSNYPVEGQTGVPTNTAIYLRFARGIEESTINQGIRIEGPSGPVAFSATVTNLAGTVSIRPRNPLQPNTTYRISLTNVLEDPTGTALVEPKQWTFTTGAGPESRMFSPDLRSELAALPRNAVVRVKGNIPFAPLLPKVRAVEVLPNGIGAEAEVEVSFNESRTVLSIAPKGLWRSDTRYRILAEELLDSVGLPAYTQQVEFVTSDQVDRDAPTLIASWPTNGQTGVLLTDEIVLEFSEPISAFRWTDQPITLFDDTGRAVATGGHISRAGAPQLEFIQPRGMEPNKTYTVRVDGLTDYAGNTMSPTEFRFTTGTQSAVAGSPKIVRTDPTESAENVSPTAPITIEFDVPVRLTALGGSAQLISGSTVIPLRLELAGTTLRAIPTSELVANESAQFSVTVTGPTGGQITPTLRWRTGASNDRTPPQVTRVDPPPGTTLSPGQRIRVVVSEPLVTPSGNSPLLLIGSGSKRYTAFAQPNEDGTVFSVNLPSDLNGPLTLISSPTATDRAGNKLTPWTGEYTVASPTRIDGLFVAQSRPWTDSRQPYLQVPGDVSLTWFLQGTANIEDIRRTWFVLENGAAVAGRWEYSSETNVLQFFPQRRLQSGARIEVLEYPASSIGGLRNSWFVITEPPADAPLHITRWFVPEVTGGVMEVELSADITGESDLVMLERNLNGRFEPIAANITRVGTRRLRIQPPGELPIGFLTLTAGSRVAGFRNSAGSYDERVSLTNLRALTTAAPREPAIVAVAPVPGQRSVAINARIVVLLDEPVNPLTVSRDTIRVRNGSQALPLLLSVSGNGRVITATPYGPLPSNVLLDVEIGGLEDRRGRTIPPRVWSFTSGAMPDFTPPVVVSRTTQRGSDNAPLHPLAVYELHFNEEISPESLTSSLPGSSVEVELRLSEDLRTLRVQPTRPLPVGRRISVSISDLVDIAGNKGYVDGVSYDVAFATDSGPVRLVSSVPPDGSVGIARDPIFRLTFDRDVPATAAQEVTLRRGSETVPLTTLERASSKELVLAPVRPLGATTEYRLVAGTFTGMGGGAFTGAEVRFTTSDAVGTGSQGRVLVSRELPANVPIRVSFSAPVAAGSVAGSRIQLTTGSRDIPVAKQLSTDGRSMTILPARPMEPGLEYRLLVEGLLNESGYPVSVPGAEFRYTGAEDLSPPQVTLSPPNGFSAAPIDAILSAHFDESPEFAGPVNSLLRLVRGGNEVSGVTVPWNNGYRFVPGQPLEPGATYRLEAAPVRDLAGNMSERATSTFTISGAQPAEAIPLQVTATRPANGDVGVALDSRIEIDFNQPVHAALAASTVWLGTESYMAIPFRSMMRGNTLVITPVYPLPPSTALRLMTSGFSGPARIPDLTGREYTVLLNVRFTTEASRDTTAPAVLSVAPAPGTVLAADSNEIAIRFSEPVDLSKAELSLRAGAEDLRGQLSTGSDTRLVYVSAYLPADKRVELVLTGVTDWSGNAAPPIRAEYQTAPARRTGEPSLQSINPFSGTLQPEEFITLEFDRAMNRDSVLNAVRVTVNGELAVARVEMRNEMTVQISPSPRWPAGSRVDVFVLDSAEDLFGQRVRRIARNWQVAGAAPTSLNLLRVSALSTALPVYLEFDGYLNASTVSEDTITLRVGSRRVPARVSLQRPRIVALEPLEPLDSRTEYIAEITPALRNEDGVAFPGLGLRLQHGTGSGVCNESEQPGLVRVECTGPVDPVSLADRIGKGAVVRVSGNGRVMEIRSEAATPAR